MNSRITHWLTPALLLLVTACGDVAAPEAGPSASYAGGHEASTPAAESRDDAAHADDHTALPLPKRLAFMTGHVEAGLALYRAGEPAMAAPHLLHPVSETHAAERVGLDELGFEAGLFETVSNALDNGVPASEIEPQLAAAKESLMELATKAGGDTLDIIDYLLDTVVEEYAIGVTDRAVTDMGEYQDAYGFTQVAIDRADTLAEPLGTALKTELERLLTLWRGAPLPIDEPAPLAAIEAQVAKVRALLEGAREPS
ncbi:MAG: hypothetical protein AAFX58_14660 [Pseudomonadota bacterium]